MQTNYFKDYSPALNRDMELKVYGHAGRPVLFIPCQDGRFFDFENYKMTDYWQPWIDAGEVMVFSIDTIDQETWSNKYGDPRWRIERYEQWINYICDEVVPFMRDYVNMCNGWDGYPGVLVFGCSLGATHAANLYFRRPDLFDRLLALSGIYSASFGFDGYMDDLVYNNSPIDYLRNMPADHPYIELYNKKRAVVCVGQGPWEIPDTTREMAYIFHEKGINVWVDFWGYDCKHDWDWWYKQVQYFLPYLLENDPEPEEYYEEDFFEEEYCEEQPWDEEFHSDLNENVSEAELPVEKAVEPVIIEPQIEVPDVGAFLAGLAEEAAVTEENPKKAAAKKTTTKKTAAKTAEKKETTKKTTTKAAEKKETAKKETAKKETTKKETTKK